MFPPNLQVCRTDACHSFLSLFQKDCLNETQNRLNIVETERDELHLEVDRLNRDLARATEERMKTERKPYQEYERVLNEGKDHYLVSLFSH